MKTLTLQQSLPLEPDSVVINRNTNPMERRMPPAVITAVQNRQHPVPRALIVSSLFQVRRRHGQTSKPRETLWRKLLVAVEGVEVTYTGSSLDQDDLLVYMEVIGLISDVARTDSLIQVALSPHALLSRMGWSPSKPNYARVRDTLTRLQATSICIRGERTEGTHRISYEYAGSLLPEFRTDTVNDRATLTLGFSADLVRFFWHGVIAVHRDILRKLEGSHLARWAYGFFIGDQATCTWPVKRLQALCGSTASPSRFRYLLEDSLLAIREAGVNLDFEFVKTGSAKSSEIAVTVNVQGFAPALC